MDQSLVAESIRRKSAALLGRIVPGMTRAESKPGANQSWMELSFPDGLSFVTSGNPLEAEYMYREIFENRVYTAQGNPLAHDSVVVDAGANCGLFTMYLLKNLARPTVYAFEPVPEVFDTLVENVSAFRNGRVRAINKALGNGTETAEMVYYPHLPGNSTLYPDLKKKQRGILALAFRKAELEIIREERKIPVATTTLSAFIREHGIERIDLLKIDTEGSETAILEGIEDGDWPRIGQISIEVHQARKRLRRISKTLETRGFNVAVVEESRDPLGSVNVIAHRSGDRA